MQERVIDLKSIAHKYIHHSNAIGAILDEDFRTRFSLMIARTLRIEDAQKRNQALQIIQNNMSEKELEKTAWALDYYGLMYDYIEKEKIKTRENKETASLKETLNEKKSSPSYLIFYKGQVIDPRDKKRLKRFERELQIDRMLREKSNGHGE